MKDQKAIYWVYEFFYLEAMTACVTSALDSAEIIIEAQQNQGAKLAPEKVLDCLQNLVQQAAALSRYFWPAPNRKSKYVALHHRRATELRAVFQVGADNPLKKRSLRNRIEHFDENLDIFLAGPVTGDFIPAYVGPTPKHQPPVEYFRAFFTDTGIFEVLGERHEIHPIYEELCRLHAILIDCAKIGYRFPKVPNA